MRSLLMILSLVGELHTLSSAQNCRRFFAFCILCRELLVSNIVHSFFEEPEEEKNYDSFRHLSARVVLNLVSTTRCKMSTEKIRVNCQIGHVIISGCGDGGVSLELDSAVSGPSVQMDREESRLIASTLFEKSFECESLASHPFSRVPMQLLTIQATQVAPHRCEQQHEGAFVYCFLKDQTEENARYIVEGMLNREGWKIEAIDRQDFVCRDLFLETDLLEFYDQALVEGESFLFHIYDEE